MDVTVMVAIGYYMLNMFFMIYYVLSGHVSLWTPKGGRMLRALREKEGGSRSGVSASGSFGTLGAFRLSPRIETASYIYFYQTSDTCIV